MPRSARLDDAADLRVGLAAEAVRADHHEVVATARGAGEPRRLVLLLGDHAAGLVHLDVAAHALAAVVARRAVRVEADQPGQPALAAVHLARRSPRS